MKGPAIESPYALTVENLLRTRAESTPNLPLTRFGL